MNIGFTVGCDGDASVGLYDEGLLVNYVYFAPERWTRFVQILPLIEDCLMNQEIIEFNQLIDEFKCLSIRTYDDHLFICVYFSGHILNAITIPCNEWEEFRNKVDEINEEMINRDQNQRINTPILCENVQSLSGIEVPSMNSVETACMKNPLCLLNEMNLTAKYELVSESGEPHCKTFVVSADVDGHLFEGSGKNKQQAKIHAVQKALDSLYGIKF